MRLVGLKHLWRRHGYRLCRGLVLWAFVLSAVGVPFPTGVAKDRSVPFPCQGKACGCRTAEECWRHCCCNTPEQRLAWARARGVTPPPYAVLDAAKGWDTRPKQRHVPSSLPGCALCAAETPRETERACCTRSCAPSSPGCSACSKPEANTTRAVTWGSTLSALKCRGTSVWWQQTGSIPPPVPTAWTPDCLLVEELPAHVIVTYSIAARPPFPPPRSVA